MSRWDAERQQWVDDDEPPPRGPYPSYEPTEPTERTEPDFPQFPVPPEDDAPRRRSHEAILAGVVAGVVLAGGIGFGVWKLTRDDGEDNHAGGGGTTSTAPATPGLSDGGVSTSGGSLTSGGVSGATTQTPTDTPTDESAGTSSSGGTGSTGSTSGGGTSGAPAGFQRVSESGPVKATFDVPQGWTRSVDGVSVFYKQDDDDFVQVYQLNGAESTPREGVLAIETSVSKNPTYQRIRLAESTDGSAAELEYAYTRDGSTRHVLLRDVMAPDRRMYALLVMGPAGNWSPYAQVHQVLVGSFCPAGYCANGG
ncbi:hypothetical protein [Streptomyces sp. UNOC14_S4]|uniref:hypothetical protein n=1 Tax=Streptomyces sp. UNOC14_S4 TaxID=2872340 RepID=UPI001E535D04|nr:hypothetical protein [Streptomyces sp. UNOC14_S4]MCC3767733.1 hypothetical protein [Streptomyces sp. UNOC14_S4]